MFLSRVSTENEATKTLLLERQKEYRTAALKAKKQGDVEQAKIYIKTSKVSLRTAILSDLFKAKTLRSVFSAEISVVFDTKDICWKVAAAACVF